MSNRSIWWVVLLLVLMPITAQAAPPTGSWQVFTTANGLRELQAFTVASDGVGGVWVGHVSGGRAIGRLGGLTHIGPDGNGRAYSDEPFRSCSSVDELALAPGNTLWMRLSGYHDYGSADYLGTCRERYGIEASGGLGTAAIGFIGPDGVPQMLPKDQLPAEITGGFAIDERGQPWIGTKRGVAVREADGRWNTITIWGADEGGTVVVRALTAGRSIAVGSATGGVAMVTSRAGAPQEVSVLPRPNGDRRFPVSDLSEGPGLSAVVANQLYQLAPGGTQWEARPVPSPAHFGPEELSYGQRLTYAGGKLWIGAPQYGLHRLDEGGWTAIPAGETPLPNQQINGLAAGDNATLLIATERGAAKLSTGGPSPDASAARGAFDTLWQRSNRGANGTWVWGPRAWWEGYEPYKEAPGGTRFVRYYDKTRMELTNPQADPSSAWYVTNGLLVNEMVRGQVQLGDDPSRSGCPFFRSMPCPSGTQVAGDIDYETNALAPNYGDFAPFLPGTERRSGTRISTSLIRESSGAMLQPAQQSSLATAATTIDAYDEATRHNIPRVFWNYMRAQPSDWLFAFGHPITEAYWIRTKVAGVDRWVLVQLFERRTLTYTPSNAAAWQVEMGNVGQHYFGWRSGVFQDGPWTR